MDDRVASYFAESYREARQKFLAAADRAGARLRAYEHPLTGPAGEGLYVDIASIGQEDASRVLLTCSATHGVEGFCGSACQIGWLEKNGRDNLPSGVGLHFIHAINPYGFAWLRRVNEDNVDINRNFINFSSDLPDNAGWKELASAICPEQWDAASKTVFRATCNDFIERHSERAFVKAITSGQYTHADGVFYGGREPVWSHRVLQEFSEKSLKDAKRLAVIDFHTGLGPYGYGELICRHAPESRALAEARRWYGDSVTSPAMGESASPVASGNLRMAFADWLPETLVVAVGLEFGTHPEDKVFDAIRADNWLHLYGDLNSRAGRAIKADIRDMFYPETDDWMAMVYRRAVQVQVQALAGLARI